MTLPPVFDIFGLHQLFFAGDFTMAGKNIKFLNGIPSKFSPSKLPTSADVIKAISYEKYHVKHSNENSIQIVVNQISELWYRTSVPIVSERRLKQKVTNLYGDFQKLSHCDLKRQSNIQKINLFKVRFHNLSFKLRISK